MCEGSITEDGNEHVSIRDGVRQIISNCCQAHDIGSMIWTNTERNSVVIIVFEASHGCANSEHRTGIFVALGDRSNLDGGRLRVIVNVAIGVTRATCA